MGHASGMLMSAMEHYDAAAPWRGTGPMAVKQRNTIMRFESTLCRLARFDHGHTFFIEFSMDPRLNRGGAATNTIKDIQNDGCAH